MLILVLLLHRTVPGLPNLARPIYITWLFRKPSRVSTSINDVYLPPQNTHVTAGPPLRELAAGETGTLFPRARRASEYRELAYAWYHSVELIVHYGTFIFLFFEGIALEKEGETNRNRRGKRAQSGSVLIDCCGPARAISIYVPLLLSNVLLLTTVGIPFLNLPRFCYLLASTWRSGLLFPGKRIDGSFVGATFASGSSDICNWLWVCAAPPAVKVNPMRKANRHASPFYEPFLSSFAPAEAVNADVLVPCRQQIASYRCFS